MKNAFETEIWERLSNGTKFGKEHQAEFLTQQQWCLLLTYLQEKQNPERSDIQEKGKKLLGKLQGLMEETKRVQRSLGRLSRTLHDVVYDGLSGESTDRSTTKH